MSSAPPASPRSPCFGERLVGDRPLVERYRAGLIVANIIWIAGLVATTGGVERPYWALMAAPLLIAAVSMSRVRSLLIGVIATVATVIAFAVAGPIGATTPASWSSCCRSAPASPGSSACSAPRSGPSAAPRGEERDELSRRVDELSVGARAGRRGRPRGAGRRPGRAPTTRCAR